MRDLGSFGTMICATWEVLVLRVSKQHSGVSRDLGSIGTMICVTWEVLVLQVLRCSVSHDSRDLGSFGTGMEGWGVLLLRSDTFRHIHVCFAT